MDKIAEELLKLARLLVSADEKFDVVGKRDGKMGKWNKKPMSKSEAESLIRDIKKATIPSVDVRSLEMIPA